MSKFNFQVIVVRHLLLSFSQVVQSLFDVLLAPDEGPSISELKITDFFFLRLGGLFELNLVFDILFQIVAKHFGCLVIVSFHVECFALKQLEVKLRLI